MAIESEFDRRALLRDSGEPASFRGRKIFVFFNESHEPVEVNGKTVSAVNLFALGSAAEIGQAKRGERIKIGEREFSIENLEPDGQGMTRAQLAYVE